MSDAAAKTDRPTTVECRGLVVGDDSSSMSAVELNLDPVAVFGRVRVPVRATVGALTFRTTLCRMGGRVWVPLRTSNRAAAGVEIGQRLRVRLEEDTEERTVEVPADLGRALRSAGVTDAFAGMSYSHRREWVVAIEGAKRLETRARRIESCVAAAVERGAAAVRKGGAKVAKKSGKARTGETGELGRARGRGARG